MKEGYIVTIAGEVVYVGESWVTVKTKSGDTFTIRKEDLQTIRPMGYAAAEKGGVAL